MEFENSGIVPPKRITLPINTPDTGTVAAILALTAELASLQAQINDLKKQINGENDFDLTVDKEKYSQTLIESVLGQYLKKVEL